MVRLCTSGVHCRYKAPCKLSSYKLGRHCSCMHEPTSPEKRSAPQSHRLSYAQLVIVVQQHLAISNPALLKKQLVSVSSLPVASPARHSSCSCSHAYARACLRAAECTGHHAQVPKLFKHSVLPHCVDGNIDLLLGSIAMEYDQKFQACWYVETPMT